MEGRLKTIVLGPPGTGKTTTLLNKVDDYLKQTDIKHFEKSIIYSKKYCVL